MAGPAHDMLGGRRDDRERDESTAHRSKHRHRSRSRSKDRDGDGRRHKSRKHEGETEDERRERKRTHREKEGRRDKGRSRSRERGKDGKRDKEGRLGVEVVDEDEDMWVEKGVDAETAVSNIPSSNSLPLRSNPSTSTTASLPSSTHTGSFPSERDSWMLEPDATAAPVSRAPRSNAPHSATTAPISPPRLKSVTESAEQEGDFFSAFGTEHKRKDPNDSKPDPSKVQVDHRELNVQLREGKKLDDYETTERKKVGAGGPGWQFRMRKLARLYEQAQEAGRPVEEVALERYGTLDEFNEAVEERRVLDERDSRRLSRRGTSDAPSGGGPSTPSTPGMRTPGGEASARRYMFSSGGGEDFSRPGSRAGFRRPGEADGTSTPTAAGGGGGGGGGGRVDHLRRTESTFRGTPGPDKVSTPIPSVFTPQAALQRQSSGYPFDLPPLSSLDMSKPALSLADLNRLQAKVLRAKLTDDEGAGELEDEYEYERLRYEAAQDGGGAWAGSAEGKQGQMGRTRIEKGKGGKEVQVETQVLPTLDGSGRLYDVGTGFSGQAEQDERRPGNKRKKEQKFETRDKQGNLTRYNADDDEQTLGELVRQERFGAGSAEQKSLDAAMAGAIAGDARYQDDLDYIDENAERLARRKMKSDAMKRQFAINDFARTKRALDTCAFCYQEERNPLTAVVALGTRTYLSCTLTEELVPGHCLIAPIQHHLSTLELEDDDWEEIRNFMKCLMRMHAKDNKGVIFFETIPSFRQQRHTYIEAVPVPFEQFQDCPAYFRESILSSESEWSQHQKLIDFSARPGGFRRALVPNIPYFMVQWDYKGEKGYGHIIEGDEENAGRSMNEDGEGGVYEGDKGGSGGFPPYFAAEVIGNILGLEPRKWMRPKRLDYSLNPERARKLGTQFQPYNWTLELQRLAAINQPQGPSEHIRGHISTGVAASRGPQSGGGGS